MIMFDYLIAFISEGDNLNFIPISVSRPLESIRYPKTAYIIFKFIKIFWMFETTKKKSLLLLVRINALA